MIFSKDSRLNSRQKKLSKLKNLPKSLIAYLSESLPSSSDRLKDIEFLALDFETTGLNPKKDRVVSFGYTVIDQLAILNSMNGHYIVNPKTELTEQNVSIHEITDDEVKSGITVSQMMEKIFELLKGRALLVHFDYIEKGFINQVCQNLYGFKDLPMLVVDTLKVECMKQNKKFVHTQPDSMRLNALRDRYNLPPHGAHHAMLDAIATAELFLAQTSYMKNPSEITLKQVI